MSTTTVIATEESTTAIVVSTTTTLAPIPTTCTFCCLLGIIIVSCCFITNIPIAIVWSRRRVLNCISMFFVAFAINFMLLSLYTLVYIILDTCVEFGNIIFKYSYVAVCFLVYTNCCLLTALMACYHCLMRMNKIQWELWTKLTTVQAVAASAALSLVIGFANLVFSGFLLVDEEEVKGASNPTSTIVAGDLLFTLWFYGLIRIGSSIVVLVCSIISIKTSTASPEPSIVNIGEETDDIIGPQMMERQDKYMKPIPGLRPDPNKILSDQFRSRYSQQGENKMRKSKVLQEAHSANMSIREAIMRQAIKEYNEKRRGREYNIGLHNDEDLMDDEESPKMHEMENAMHKASRLRFRKAKAENEDTYDSAVKAVSLLFIVFELPVGMLCFASSKHESYMDIFKSLAIYMDMLPFIRNTLHIFMFIIVSEKFRRGFMKH